MERAKASLKSTQLKLNLGNCRSITCWAARAYTGRTVLTEDTNAHLHLQQTCRYMYTHCFSSKHWDDSVHLVQRTQIHTGCLQKEIPCRLVLGAHFQLHSQMTGSVMLEYRRSCFTVGGVSKRQYLIYTVYGHYSSNPELSPDWSSHQLYSVLVLHFCILSWLHKPVINWSLALDECHQFIRCCVFVDLIIGIINTAASYIRLPALFHL